MFGLSISWMHLFFPDKARELHRTLERLRAIWGEPRNVDYSDAAIRLIGVALAAGVAFAVCRLLD